MKYTPIRDEEEALEKVEGGHYEEFFLVTYEEQWQRDEGEPEYERYELADYAVEAFMDACCSTLCVELRGVNRRGEEVPLLIGGTAPDLSEGGEYIE